MACKRRTGREKKMKMIAIKAKMAKISHKKRARINKLKSGRRWEETYED